MLKEFFKLDNKIIVITGASHIAFLDTEVISKVFFDGFKQYKNRAG